MKVIDYLREYYGYYEPIFLKDIKIGRKSKEAIRKELSRAVKNGDVVRKSNGVYSLRDKNMPVDGVTFESIVERKFVKDDFGVKGLDFFVYGYYSGYTFLNYLGISQQVPAVIEVVTNNTSCKRIYSIGKRKAIVRKGKITINRFNYKALQFFDAISILSDEEIQKNNRLLFDYIQNNLSKADFENYAFCYPPRLMVALGKGGLFGAFR